MSSKKTNLLLGKSFETKKTTVVKKKVNFSKLENNREREDQSEREIIERNDEFGRETQLREIERATSFEIDMQHEQSENETDFNTIFTQLTQESGKSQYNDK